MTLSDWWFDRLINTFLGSQNLVPDVCMYVSLSQVIEEVRISNLPSKTSDVIRIVVVSDTHGRHDKITLPGGDLFIHCGDVLMTSRLFSHENTEKKLRKFNDWLADVPCTEKVVIAGNHDDCLERIGKIEASKLLYNAVYLENDYYQYKNLSIFGSPYSSGNSSNKAFQLSKTKSEFEAVLPRKVDVLLTHGRCPEIRNRFPHRLHLWGHSHNSYGIRKPGEVDRDQKLEALSVCAPTMNGTFQLAHHPVVIDIHAPRHDDEAKTGATVGNYRVGLLNATSEPNQFRPPNKKWSWFCSANKITPVSS